MDKDSLNLLFNKLSVLEKSLATPTDASSEIMKVTPYNGFGYGLSLLIVFIFAMIMYRQWQKSESYDAGRVVCAGFSRTKRGPRSVE